MKIPKKINKKSPTIHIEVTKKILFFFIPCSITNKFCAPIASIKLKPVEKPKINSFMTIFHSLYTLHLKSI